MSATGEPTGSAELCGYWMPVAQAYCSGKPGHRGQHRPRKTVVRAQQRRNARRWTTPQSDPAAAKARWNRAHKFVRLGITEEQFLQILKDQGYACGICKEPFRDGQRICTDHDHGHCPPQPNATAKTCGKCIRGLLCVRCNTRLEWTMQHGSAIDAYLKRAKVDRAGLEPATFSV